MEIEDHIHFFLPDQFHDVCSFTVNRIVPVIAGVIVRTPVFALIAVHDSIPVRKRNRKDFERFAEFSVFKRFSENAFQNIGRGHFAAVMAA